jgi:hypothetical protein
VILDSPFTDLTTLAEELVERGRRNGMFAPSLAVMMVMRSIRSSVLATAGFDIRDISPISYAESCFIPALFIAADGDAFISPRHSQRLCEVYSGDKNLIIVKGDHNSVRPVFLYDSVAIFLINALGVPEEMLLRGMSTAYVGRSPWRLTQQQYGGYGREVPLVGKVATESVSVSGIDVQLRQLETDAEFAWRLMQEELDEVDRKQRRRPVRRSNEESAVDVGEELSMGMTRERQEEVSDAICGVFGAAKAKPSQQSSSSEDDSKL